ncbi:MAG: aldehyde:ferredoxin oxidoreductase [Deltaproteobacteria bacterium]|nr:aldehyde:ferredoxin oxidoreductase [Deltaproteobacteria bacterium]
MEIINRITYKPSPVNGGYTDTILNVDLSEGAISPVGLPPQFKDTYVGGRGYALKLIWDGTTAETRYDSPENILVMAGGPLCSEPWFPGSGKFIIGTISPLTDTFIDSNIGGHFAPLLKLCGFDALAVTGIADRDVVLIVDADAGVIELAEAPSFGEEIDEGALTYGDALIKEVNNGLLDENVAATTTGIGAVNTRFGIVNSLFYDRRRERLRAKQAGRGGTGTVMRRKGLRGVVVRANAARLKANQPVNEKGVKAAGAGLKQVISKVDPKQLRLGAWGTTGLVEYMDKFHILPVENYQYGQDERAKKVFGDIFEKRYFGHQFPDGCYTGCNLACAKGAEDVLLEHGPWAGKRVGIDGPEYETAGAVTAMGIFDPQFVMEFNWYCDQYGLDTISMGVTAAFLMECFQRGYLTTEDVGYPLDWGNVESVDRLLQETARGEGFGKICGQGVLRSKDWVAKRYAAGTGKNKAAVLDELNKFAMEVKGLEFSMYGTKESLAQQGGYGFALKGPQHDEAWLIFIDQVYKELPTFEDKAKALKWFPLIRTWFNAVGLCKLPWIDVRHPEAAETDNPAQNRPTLAYYVDYINATTGSDKNLQDILDDSERLYLLQKMINLRHGKGTRESDRIPLRAMGPAFINEYESRSEHYEQWLNDHSGGKAIPPDPADRLELLIQLRQEAYERLCDAVYSEKGFRPDGVPLPETLERTGLLDKQAADLLSRYDIVDERRKLSN